MRRTYNLVLDIEVSMPDDPLTLDAAVENVVEQSTAREAIETGLDGVNGWTTEHVSLAVGTLPTFSIAELGMIVDALADYIEGGMEIIAGDAAGDPAIEAFVEQARSLRKRVAYDLIEATREPIDMLDMERSISAR